MTDDTTPMTAPETPAEPVAVAPVQPAPAAPAPEYPAPTYLATQPAAPVADTKRRHGWPVWVASAAIALVIFAAGAHVGFALGARFATRGIRAGVVGAQVQQRGAAQGRGFGRGFRR